MSSIKLDKQRNIKYTFAAIDQAEKKTDMLWDELVVKALRGKMKAYDIFALIWAGLWVEDNTLTIESVMDLVYEYSTLDEIMIEVGEAIAEAMKKIKAPKTQEKN